MCSIFVQLSTMFRLRWINLFAIFLTSYLSIVNAIPSVYKVCDHPECILFSSSISDWMNHQIDPCTNLTEFACGSFFSRTVHNDRYRKISRGTIAQDKILEQRRKVLASDLEEDDIDVFKLVKRFFSLCTYTGE